MTNKQKIETYKAAVAYAKQHIKELENHLDKKQNRIESLIERELEFRIDELGQDKRLATRQVYKDIYEEMSGGSRYKFLTECPNEYLSRQEQEEWFDEYHDRHVTSGDHIANSDYEDLMNYELSTLPTERKELERIEQRDLPMKKRKAYITTQSVYNSHINAALAAANNLNNYKKEEVELKPPSPKEVDPDLFRGLGTFLHKKI